MTWLICALSVICISLFMLIRNSWVYRLRTWMIRADLEQFRRMPSYDAMLYRVWIWSARGFGWEQP